MRNLIEDVGIQVLPRAYREKIFLTQFFFTVEATNLDNDLVFGVHKDPVWPCREQMTTPHSSIPF